MSSPGTNAMEPRFELAGDALPLPPVLMNGIVEMLVVFDA